MSPFNWQGQPIVFASDRQFMAQGKSGTSQSIKSAARVIKERKADPKFGTLRGISRKSDLSIPPYAAPLVDKESTPDAMARRTKLMRSAI